MTSSASSELTTSLASPLVVAKPGVSLPQDVMSPIAPLENVEHMEEGAADQFTSCDDSNVVDLAAHSKDAMRQFQERFGLTLRPWTTFAVVTWPVDRSTTLARIRSNMAYFRGNYLTICAVLFSAAVAFIPPALFTAVFLGMAWVTVSRKPDGTKVHFQRGIIAVLTAMALMFYMIPLVLAAAPASMVITLVHASLHSNAAEGARGFLTAKALNIVTAPSQEA